MDKLRLILRRKKTREHIEKPSKHGKDQLQQLYSHEFQVILRINTRLYPGGHPSSYNPVRSGLTWNSVVKRNALTTSATSKIQIYKMLTLEERNSFTACSRSLMSNSSFVLLLMLSLFSSSSCCFCSFRRTIFSLSFFNLSVISCKLISPQI